MSHDIRGCPERFGRQRHYPEPSNRVVKEKERKRQRVSKEEFARPKRTTENHNKRREDKPAERVEPKPIRSDLMEELGEAVADREEKMVLKASTREWVRKTFATGESKDSPKLPQENRTGEPPVTELAGGRPNWLRPTIHEADVARAVYA